MINYDQHMKHWKNHSKDRYTQQCAGPQHNPDATAFTCAAELEMTSFLQIMESLKDTDFPVFVKQGSRGIWSLTNARDSFGSEIASMEDMRKFYHDYVT